MNELNRIVAINANAYLHPKDKQYGENLTLLFKGIRDNGIPIIREYGNGGSGCFLYKHELDKYFADNPDHPAKNLFVKESICPICGCMTPFGLYRDYRDNNGCISSCVSCVNCRHLDNEMYNQLSEMNDDMIKVQYVVGLIMEDFSPTAQNIMQTRMGFRSESYSGSMVRDLKEVVSYELGMGNNDIIKFCQEQYHLDVESPDEDSILADRLYYESGVWQVVKERLGDPKGCDALWLTSLKGVTGKYLGGGNYDYDLYILPPRFMVLSDLGEDGILVAYKKDEQPCVFPFRNN